MKTEVAGQNTPTPETRRRVPNPQGIPVKLGDGRQWVLAYGCLAPGLLALADQVFDQLLLASTIPMAPSLLIAWKLLLANYDLADHEIQGLLDGAKDEDLAHAATDAMFGPSVPRRTWSTWALSALYANGIEPSEVPPWLVPEVLHQLVNTGRAMGQSDYIDSASASKQRAELFARLPQPRQQPENPVQVAPGPQPSDPDFSA